MAHETPEEINARLLGRVLELERELAEMQARVGMGRPDLPRGEDIRRIRKPPMKPVWPPVGLEGEVSSKAMALAGDFLELFDTLLLRPRGRIPPAINPARNASIA